MIYAADKLSRLVKVAYFIWFSFIASLLLLLTIGVHFTSVDFSLQDTLEGMFFGIFIPVVFERIAWVFIFSRFPMSIDVINGTIKLKYFFRFQDRTLKHPVVMRRRVGRDDEYIQIRYGFTRVCVNKVLYLINMKDCHNLESLMQDSGQVRSNDGQKMPSKRSRARAK